MFEDFPVGHCFETGSVRLGEEDIIAFARDHDPQPFHIDREAAEQSTFGGIIASGFQTLICAFNLTLRDGGWAEGSMGSPGMRDIRWLRPVRPGDTLRVKACVLESRASRSKPDRGIVVFEYVVLNQDDTKVMTYTATQIFARRNAAQA